MFWTRYHFETRNAALATAGGFVLLLAAMGLGLDVLSAAEVSFEIMADKDAPGNDFKRFKGVSVETCEARCREESRCAAFTYNHRRKFCFLKDKADPPLEDYRGATTGLKKILQDTARAPSEPELDSPIDDVTLPQPDLPDEPVIRMEPETQTAGTENGCTLFKSDFALIRDPNVTLEFSQVQRDGADKARMVFYDRGKEVLSGRLRLEADRFRFVQDGDGSVRSGITILDRTHPSGNSVSNPGFVVVGGLPFDGGVFKRSQCRAP